MRIGKRISVGLLSLALGFTAGTADAQPDLVSVAISSPDSGKTVAIGGTVTVTASVFQSSADRDLTVLAWLVSGGATATAYDVLFDGSVSASPDNNILGALQANSAVGNESAAYMLACLQGANCGGANKAFLKGTPLKDVTGTTDATSFVAARQLKGSAVGKDAKGLALDAVFGDANTAAAASKVTNSGDTYTYTIALKIPESAGNKADADLPVDGVRVAAVAFDPNTTTVSERYSAIKVTPKSVAVSIDADRPSQEGISISTTDGTGSTGNVYLQWANGNTNKNVSISAPNGGADVANSTAAGNAAFHVGGFTTGPVREVATTGDKIQLSVDLNKNDDSGPGPQENAIKSPSSTLSLVADLFGTEYTVDKTQAGAVLAHTVTIGAGDFKDLAQAATTNVMRLYVVDAAGNKSSANSAGQSGNPYSGDDSTTNLNGVSNTVAWLIDSTNPNLADSTKAAPHTTLLRVTPASGATISDGTISDTDKDGDVDANDTRSVASDGSHLTAKSADKVLSWHPNEDLRSVDIEFVGSKAKLTISGGATPTFDRDNMGNDEITYLDITDLAKTKNGNAITNDGTFSARVATSTANGGNTTAATGDAKMVDGTYDIKVTPTDLAGNKGATVTREDVTIDFTALEFKRRFPTKGSFGDATADRRDTINETTANVTFALSEEADSVKIIFDDIAGSANDTFFVLSSAQLKDTSEQTILIGPSLTDKVNYEVTLIGRDKAGNYSTAGPDTLRFDKSFTAPTIAKFVIEAIDGASPPVVQGVGKKNPFLAGTDIRIRIKATDAAGKTAVTFDDDAVLTIEADTVTVAGCAKCAVTGDGVAKTAATTWSLTGKEFVVGQQTVTITNEVAPETLSVSVADAATKYAGKLSDVIAYDPQVYSAINVSAPKTVDQGQTFTVKVTLADKFGNTRFQDNRFVEVTSNVAGAQLPAGAIAVKKGSASFEAVFASGSTHTITVRDIVSTSADAKTAAYPNGTGDLGGDFISGSVDVNVNSGPVAANLDGPDAAVAKDYMGADGAGDQGGFVIIHFAASTDHATLDEYLIERKISVKYAPATSLGITTIDELAAAKDAWVAWGSVAPTPGAAEMHVIVATLDNVESEYSVSAVRGGLVDSKKAFSVSDDINSPYELMSRTLQRSRDLTQVDVNAPVIASLSPQALAFAETGVVPRMKSGAEARSRATVTNAIKAIDNIAPAPVSFVRALDTAGDQGGSITLQWSKSIDDQLLVQSVPNAIGGAQTYQVQGVKGYNVYRMAGLGEYTLIAEAGPGETSYLDQTVFNGMPYTYQVRPRDTDNVAKTELTSSALAVRNNVRDAKACS